MDPEALRNKPNPDRRQQYYLDIFSFCSRFRGLGERGPAKLTLSDMNAYFQIYKIKGVTQRDDILKRVAVLDTCFVNHLTLKSQDQKPEA